MKKKVETRTRDIFQKSKKIELSVVSHPEGATPKMISAETGLNINTIKSILPKMENIYKATRGLYKVYINRDSGALSTLENWNFHNCILTLISKNKPNKTTLLELDLDLFKVELILNVSGKCTCRISTDYPMNVSSINLACALFSNLVKSNLGEDVDINNIIVKTIEFNQDYANLRLDGCQSITLDSLNNQFKLYQKRVGLRVEHKTKVKFQAQDLVEVLKTKPNELELGLRLNRQKDQLDRLTMNVSNMTKTLFKMIDKMNRRLEHDN